MIEYLRPNLISRKSAFGPLTREKSRPMDLHLKLEYRQFPNQFCIWQTHKLINAVRLQWSIITVCLWDQDRFYALLRNVVDNWIKKNHWPCMHRMSRPRDQSVRCACTSQFKIKCLFRYFIKPLAICSKTIHSNCVFFFSPSSACVRVFTIKLSK